MAETDNPTIAAFRKDVESTISGVLELGGIDPPRCDRGGQLAASLMTKLLAERYPLAYDALTARYGRDPGGASRRR